MTDEWCCGSIPKGEIALRLTGCDRHGRVSGSVLVIRRERRPACEWALFSAPNHLRRQRLEELHDWSMRWLAWAAADVEWTEPPPPGWLDFSRLDLASFDADAADTPWDQLGLF